MRRREWRQNKKRPSVICGTSDNIDDWRNIDVRVALGITPRPMSSVGDLYRDNYGTRWEITRITRDIRDDASVGPIYELLELDTEGPRTVRMSPTSLSSSFEYLEGGRENIPRPPRTYRYNIGDLFIVGVIEINIISRMQHTEDNNYLFSDGSRYGESNIDQYISSGAWRYEA